MKKLILSLFAVSLLSVSYSQTKRALIVAVGEYAKKGEFNHMNVEKGYWNSISSANDLPLVKGALSHHQFEEENIAVLQDKAATKEGILKAIRQLIDDAEKNDIVVFHYSGHGQQIMDDNGDEIDGFDEALVPYDAPSRYRKGVYEGEKHIRDDQVGGLMTELRSKLGPDGHLLIVFDTCHSGTATRGVASARGTEDKLAPEDYVPNLNPDAQEKELGGAPIDEKGLAPYVFFSASNDKESCYEIFANNNKRVGLLSYSLYRAMVYLDSNSSYTELLNKVKVLMPSHFQSQTPQINGNINSMFLNGKASPALTCGKVKDVLPNNNIVIDGGFLTGLYDGLIVGIDKNYAVGEVVNTGSIKSEIELYSHINSDAVIHKYLHEVESHYNTKKIRVKLSINESPELENILKTTILESEFIKEVNDNPDIIVEMNNKFTSTNKKNVLQIFTASYYKLFQQNIESTDMELAAVKSIRSIESYFFANNLRQLELHNEKINVELSIVPVEINSSNKHTETKINSDKNHQDEKKLIKNGDFFKFKIYNRGASDVYISVMGIAPDNSIHNVFYSDSLIQSGSNIIFNEIFEADNPYGINILKVISTTSRINHLMQPSEIEIRQQMASKRGARGVGFLIDNTIEHLINTLGKSNQITPFDSSYGSITTMFY